MSWFGIGIGPKNGDPLMYPEIPTVDKSEDLRTYLDKKFAEAQAMVDSPAGWTPIPLNEPELRDIQLSERQTEGSPFMTIKVIGTIPASPTDLLAILSITDVETLKKWDVDLISYKIHAKLAEDLLITYATYHTPYPITHRNFVTVKGLKRLPNGTIIYGSSSVNHTDYPVDTNYVRGLVNLSLYVIQPVEGNPKASQLIRIASIDPKGSIPAFVVNMFKTKAAKSYDLLRKYIEANPPK